MTQKQFLEHAATIFGIHPVEEVALWDRAPMCEMQLFSNDRLYGWSLHNSFVRADKDAIKGELWDLLPGKVTSASRSARKWFISLEKSLNALSQACVSYGRAAAELPPLE